MLKNLYLEQKWLILLRACRHVNAMLVSTKKEMFLLNEIVTYNKKKYVCAV